MSDFLSGFDNAPVTHAFLTSSALFTIFFGIQGRSIKLGLSYQDIFREFRLWKLIVSIFSFSSTPELMFGMYLLYYFRVFERQIGSNKYSVFVFFSVIASILFEVLSLAFLKESVASIVASGPYGLIFSSFVSFFFDIPRHTRFNVFGMQFSDKVFIYLAGFQLLSSSHSRSILPGLCGVLAGSLYRLNVLGIRKAKIPEGILSYFSRFSWLFVEGPPSSPSSNIVGNVAHFSPHQAERNSPPVAVVVEPTEDSISTLVSMGFDGDSARQALVHARSDISMATNNLLLEGQSHSNGDNIF